MSASTEYTSGHDQGARRQLPEAMQAEVRSRPLAWSQAFHSAITWSAKSRPS